MSEVHQKKIITCPNGHPYDPSKYDSCPYCSGQFAPTLDPFARNVGGVSPTGGFGKTIDPMGGGFRPTDGPYTPGKFQPIISPDGTNLSGDMGNTMFVDNNASGNSVVPVVGWLVAISGPNRGTEYRIHTGYNYIGRISGDIRIPTDPTISSARDSSVTYVPQTNAFYIAHEQGKNPMLLNGRPMIREAELKSYDRVTVGKTEFLFIALCGEQFDWGEG